MSLQAKRIVIIGGSSGFGLETAKKAVAAGAEVIIASTPPRAASAKPSLAARWKLSSWMLRRGWVEGVFREDRLFRHLVTRSPTNLVVPT